MLWDVAYADGRIDKYEDYTIRKISDLLYIKHADFIKAKLRQLFNSKGCYLPKKVRHKFSK